MSVVSRRNHGHAHRVEVQGMLSTLLDFIPAWSLPYAGFGCLLSAHVAARRAHYGSAGFHPKGSLMPWVKYIFLG